MAIYELKPPVVDAIQWTGDNVDEMLAFGYPLRYIQTGNRGWLEFAPHDDSPRRVAVGDYVYYQPNEGFSTPMPTQVMSKEYFEAKYKLRESGN